MDETAAATMQNTQMLREIRDEIRTSRNVSLGAAGIATTGNTGLVARAQAASDRVLAADWASLGWSGAYTTQIRNNLFDDIGAVTGFSRAPSTLTQSEYYGLARENLLSLRPHNLVSGILAPRYSARVNALADDIFANSPRFARFGSSDSPLGVGLTRTGAYGLAKSVQNEYYTNMRLSGEDLSQITSTGLQTGQFDTTSASEFMSKLRELANATADVTRTLRVSASEASQAMGGLRNIGVTSVADQRNVLMGVGAAAGVAGLTTGEMLAGGFNAASTGVGLGLGGGQSMLGFARTAAQMRGLTQAGAVSEYTMARGGGATAVASTIFNAEAQFATSDAGYLSYIGRQTGKTGNFYDELSGGVGEIAKGGFYGGLRSQRRRADITSKMSDEDRREGMRSFISRQIEMFGVRDMYSEEAQDLAFDLAKNMGMDESAAQIYATANFSKQGAFASDRTKLLTARSRKLQESKLADDELYTYTTFAGKFERAKRQIGKAWAGAAEWSANKLSAGQTGFGGFGWGANVNQQREDVLNGNVSHNADIVSLIKAADIKETYDTINLYSSGTSAGWGVAGEIGGGIAGTLGGRWAGAKIGGMVGLGGGLPGFLIGAAGGALVGMAGAAIGQNLFASGNVLFGGSPYTQSLQGAQARQYLDVARAMRGKNSLESGKAVLKTGKLSDSATFRALTSGQMNRGEMNVADSVKFSEDITKIAQETNMSVSDVISGVQAAGIEGNLASAFSGINRTGPGEEVTKGLREFVGEASTANFMISENAAALQEFVSAAFGRGSNDASINNRYVNAVAGLKSVGVTSEGIESIYGNVKRLGLAKASKFAEMMGETATYGASRQIRDFTSGVLGYAEDLVSGETGSEKEGLTKELESVRTRMDKGATTSEILDTLTTSNTKLGAFLSRKSKLIGSISGITAEELTRESAKSLADKYGMQSTVFATIKEQIANGTYSNAEQGVRAVKLSALQQEVNKPMGEDQSAETRAIIKTFDAARAAMVAATKAMEQLAR